MKSVLAFLPLVFAEKFKIATYDGANATTADWVVQNDPVMGGGSVSSFTIDDEILRFNGSCNLIPFLGAPGFAKVRGDAAFGDLTGYQNIALKVRSTTPDYAGFKVGFEAPGIPKSTVFSPNPNGQYKAGFSVQGQDWQVIEIPYAQFSWDTSAFTGLCNTADPNGGQQHYCCSDSDLQPSKAEVCIQDKYLNTISRVEVWAEGVEGDFDIEVEWIGATNSAVSI